MSEYLNEETFRSVRRGGYDREDVDRRFAEVKKEAADEKNKLLLVLKGKEKKIGELNDLIAAKEKENQKLEGEVKQLRRDIDEKYKTYIDNYDTITQLVYDARIRANQMISDAETERDRILRNAELESDRIRAAARESADLQLGRAQDEMDAKIRDGRRNYAAIQDEITELVSLVNEIQHKFMKSVKSIHEISDSVLEIQIDEADFDDTEDIDSYPTPEDENRFVEEAMAMLDDEEGE